MAAKRIGSLVRPGPGVAGTKSPCDVANATELFASICETHIRASMALESNSMGNYSLRIVFEDLEADLAGVDLRIYLEDISEADAPSKVLAERTISNASISRSRPVYLVSIDAPVLDSGARVSARVHVDTSRSGTTTAGDYLSTSVCLLPRTPPAAGVDVHVHRI